MKLIKKILHDWMTEPNNDTYCLVKGIIASGAVIYFAATLIDVIHNKSFDFEKYGLGLGAIIACAGGGLMMKKDSNG